MKKRNRRKAKQGHEQLISISDLADITIENFLRSVCAGIAFGGFREPDPTEMKKASKQLQGPKVGEIEIEPGVYLSEKNGQN